MASRLKILIIDSNAERAAVVEAGLAGLGEMEILRAAALADMGAEIDRNGADVIVVDCDSADRDTLENMREINATRPRPIVMFVEKSDPSLAEEAIRAGVSAYIVDGLSEKRVRSILEVAISRFKVFQELRGGLEKAKSDLAARKTIERAKGILMDRKKLSEAGAYKLLRHAAMAERKTIFEIAEAIVSASRMLTG